MTGSGTSNDPFVIHDLNDLQLVGSGSPYFAYLYYELANDIDATPTATWNWSAGRGVYEGLDPIGGDFSGNFDGKYYTIDGVHVNRATSYGGLFKYITTGAVKNIFISNADITIIVTGNDVPCYAGVLVGRLNSGDVECAIVDGTVSGTCTDTLPTTYAYNSVGGLIGHNWGSATVKKCAANASVEAHSYIHATCRVGGLIGFASGCAVQDCYARGSVIANGHNTSRTPLAAGLIAFAAGGSRYRCYSTGAVSATGGYNPTKGGLLAYQQYETTYNSFWDTETSGMATSDGGTGKTTAEMKTVSTFTDAGWDFSSVWGLRTLENDGYPYLKYCAGGLVFPTDPVTRVSAIRRIFRPGLYRMELALGELGFSWDVPEVAMRKTVGEIAEPEPVLEEEKEPFPTPEAIEEANRRFWEESWPKAVESLELMFPERPPVSGKYTPPAPRPKITLTDPVTGESLKPSPTDKIVGRKTFSYEALKIGLQDCQRWGGCKGMTVEQYAASLGVPVPPH